MGLKPKQAVEIRVLRTGGVVGREVGDVESWGWWPGPGRGFYGTVCAVKAGM